MAKKKRKPGAMYFTDIARVGEDKVLLAGHTYRADENDEQISILLSLDKGVWGGNGLTGIVHTARFDGGAADRARAYLALERNGGLYSLLANRQNTFCKINPRRPGFLMDLRLIGDHWYTVGRGHQVHRCENGKWKAIDRGIYIADKAGDTKVLLSIAGCAEDDIYTVGFDGVILHYDGKRWAKLSSPADVGLQRVLCVSEDEVYLCGNAGALYRGNKNAWERLVDPDESVTFWDMAYFKKKVYVCTKKKLFTIEKSGLKAVKIDVPGPLGFYRLCADDKELWSCGNECVLQFNGKTWKQYIYPENT